MLAANMLLVVRHTASQKTVGSKLEDNSYRGKTLVSETYESGHNNAIDYSS